MKELVKEGYTVKDACFSLGVSRSRYYRSLSKGQEVHRVGSRVSRNDSGRCRWSDDEVIYRIKSIKREHPFWGYRHVCAWLRHREGIVVNWKRVYRLMKENGLLVKNKVYKARRKPLNSKPRAEKPLQFWG